MGGNTKKYQFCFFQVVFCAFLLRNQKIFSICYTFKKWLYFSHSLPFYYYLFIFFLVFIPGITQTRLGAFGERRGRGGRASRSSPPRPTLTTPISNSSFLRFVWGQNSASHHQTLFDCLPYFLNYYLLVISSLLRVFNLFVYILILLLLPLFLCFFSFFS